LKVSSNIRYLKALRNIRHLKVLRKRYKVINKQRQTGCRTRSTFHKVQLLEGRVWTAFRWTSRKLRLLQNQRLNFSWKVRHHFFALFLELNEIWVRSVKNFPFKLGKFWLMFWWVTCFQTAIVLHSNVSLYLTSCRKTPDNFCLNFIRLHK
jgi:hypothetical protein